MDYVQMKATSGSHHRSSTKTPAAFQELSSLTPPISLWQHCIAANAYRSFLIEARMRPEAQRRQVQFPVLAPE
jgi:hypothetical protein